MICPHCRQDIPYGATVCWGCQAEVRYGIPSGSGCLVFIGSVVAAFVMTLVVGAVAKSAGVDKDNEGIFGLVGGAGTLFISFYLWRWWKRRHRTQINFKRYYRK